MVETDSVTRVLTNPLRAMHQLPIIAATTEGQYNNRSGGTHESVLTPVCDHPFEGSSGSARGEVTEEQADLELSLYTGWDHTATPGTRHDHALTPFEEADRCNVESEVREA